MFEIDDWVSTTPNEEKLVHSLFGKRRSQKHEDNDGLSSSTVTSKKKKSKSNGKRDEEFLQLKTVKKLPEENEVRTGDKQLKTSPRKRKAKRKNSKKVPSSEKIIDEHSKKLEVLEDMIAKKDNKIFDQKPENRLHSMNGKGKNKKRKREGKIGDDKNKLGIEDEKNQNAFENSISLGKSSSKKELPSLPSSKKSKTSSLQEKLQQRLESSRFRWINEQLYTIPGNEALDLFEQDSSLFEVYHQGFRRQVHQWPVNPVNVIISWIKERSPSLDIADFGCGEAVISQSVPNNVNSFDLVAINDRVTACNMANVPLKAASIDVAVFCLSLMGTDLEAFLKEAYRVLRPGGMLKIAEVVSRMETTTFVPALCKLGFKLDNMDETNKMFILLDFIKIEKEKQNQKVTKLQLKPCLYKRR